MTLAEMPYNYADYNWGVVTQEFARGQEEREREVSNPAHPVLGDILRSARTHQRMSLRQVEKRTGVPNAHLSQIERGTIRRPDVMILMELAELYGLDYRLVAEWAGYLDPDAPRVSGNLAGMALRLFVELDPADQHDALSMLERMRNESRHSRGEPSLDD